MKKRIILPVAAIVLIIITAVFLFVFSDSEARENRKEITELTKQAYLFANEPKHLISKDKYRISDFTDEEIETFKSEYQARLLEIYKEGCYITNDYIKRMNEYFSDTSEKFVCVLNQGFFDFDISIEFQDDTHASSKASALYWGAYVGHDSGEEYDAYFPVVKDEYTYEYEYTDEGWKIVKRTSANFTPGGDSDKYKSFDSFAEAYEYAINTKPDNVQ